MATNYEGLQVVSAFRRSYFACRWRIIRQQQNDLLIDIFSGSFDCEARRPHEDFDLKCVESNGIINSTLVMLLSLQSDVTVSVACTETELNSAFNEIITAHLIVAGECTICISFVFTSYRSPQFMSMSNFLEIIFRFCIYI